MPVDPQAELNPIAVDRDAHEDERPARKGVARSVAQLGRSAAPGDYSAASLGARVQTWQLAELAEAARKAVKLADVEEEAEGGSVRDIQITGPLSLAIRTFSDRITIDLGFPAMHIDYEDFLTGCNVPLSIGGIKAHLELDLEARYLYPSQVAAKDLPGSPKVTFDSFSSGEHLGCSILATISDTDMKAKAIQAFELALRLERLALRPGRRGARVEDQRDRPLAGARRPRRRARHALPLGARGRRRRHVHDGQRVRRRPRCAARRSAIRSSRTRRRAPSRRTRRTRRSRSGCRAAALYDVALALAPDTINQLFGAMMAGGKLEELMAGRTLDLDGVRDRARPREAEAGDEAGPDRRAVPHRPARPPGGGTEVQIGQLLLEIPSLDGTDSFRAAVDLKGAVSFAIVADEPLLPVVWDDPTRRSSRSASTSRGLDAQVVHIPKTTIPASSRRSSTTSCRRSPCRR